MVPTTYKIGYLQDGLEGAGYERDSEQAAWDLAVDVERVRGLPVAIWTDAESGADLLYIVYGGSVYSKDF
jgi:hypothetical protein